MYWGTRLTSHHTHTMDVDEYFQKYEEFGRYQRQIFWVIATMSSVQAFHNVHHVFLGNIPKFYCVIGDKKILGCPTGEEAALQCEKYVFPADDFTSVVSEWELVCDKAYLSSIIQSIYMFGFLFGNVLFGWMADQHGRRPVIITAFALLGVFTVIGAMSQSYNMYVGARFGAGACSAGFGLAIFTFSTEIIGASKRSFIGATLPAAFSVGICMFSLLAYYIRPWRYLTIATMVPCFVAIYWYFTLPESPRWLLSQGRVQEAERILQNFVVRNTGRPVSEPIRLRDPTKNRSARTSSQGSMLDMIRYPELRWITFNNFFTWFVNCLVYYGITMNAGNLGSNIYISNSLSGLVEMPAFVIMGFAMDRFGRRYSFSASMLLSGAMCLAILILPDGFGKTRTALALGGKFGITISFCLAYVYVAELYPTTIRNKAIGAINVSARAGAIVAPLVLAFGATYWNSDFLIFGALSFLAGFVALRLPETLNRPMAETLSDLVKQAHGHGHAQGHGPSQVKKVITEGEKVKLLQGEIAANEEGILNKDQVVV